MRRSALFYIAVAITIISIVMAVYFLIPGIYHPYISLSSGHLRLVDATKHPRIVTSVHRFYAAAFFLLAVIFAIAVLRLRPRKFNEVATK